MNIPTGWCIYGSTYFVCRHAEKYNISDPQKNDNTILGTSNFISIIVFVGNIQV